MKFQYHFGYSNVKWLQEYLEENKIKYYIDPNLIVFDLWSDNKNFEKNKEDLYKMKVREIFVAISFSKKEIEQSEWIWLWPMKQRIDIKKTECYDASCFYRSRFSGEECYSHINQKSSLVIENIPSMKGRIGIWTESTGFRELFGDYRIKKLMTENDMKGIRFDEVIYRKKTSDDFFQILSDNVLGYEDFKFGYGENLIVCPDCGKKQYEVDNTYQLHIKKESLKDDQDFYMSECIFGRGFGYRVYIISQRFYQKLVEAKLDRGLDFFPVIIEE